LRTRTDFNHIDFIGIILQRQSKVVAASAAAAIMRASHRQDNFRSVDATGVGFSAEAITDLDEACERAQLRYCSV